MKIHEDIAWGVILLALLYFSGFVFLSLMEYRIEQQEKPPTVCRNEFGQRIDCENQESDQ